MSLIEAKQPPVALPSYVRITGDCSSDYWRLHFRLLETVVQITGDCCEAIAGCPSTGPVLIPPPLPPPNLDVTPAWCSRYVGWHNTPVINPLTPQKASSPNTTSNTSMCTHIIMYACTCSETRISMATKRTANLIKAHSTVLRK